MVSIECLIPCEKMVSDTLQFEEEDKREIA